MERKTIITIAMVAILALIFAIFIFNKNVNTEANIDKSVTQDRVVENTSDDVITEEENDEAQMQGNADSVEIKQTLTRVDDKNRINNVIKNNDEDNYENNVLQEGSITKEVEEDYGIKKIGDTVEITREFRIKAPTKYSFRDFGILDRVSK